MPRENGYSKSASLYDLFAHKEDLEFFGRHALKEGRALDIGAGTGRLAIPLAERGVDLVCIEPCQRCFNNFAKSS